jgi:hypothetical protein
MRYHEDMPAGTTYEEDCGVCGREFERGDLAWVDDLLTCDACTTKVEAELSTKGA